MIVQFFGSLVLLDSGLLAKSENDAPYRLSAVLWTL